MSVEKILLTKSTTVYKWQKTVIISHLVVGQKTMLLEEKLDLEQRVSHNDPAKTKLTEVEIPPVIGSLHSRLLVLSNEVKSMKAKINKLPKGVRVV